VVGIFSAAGGLAESEIWTDSAVLQSAYQRGTTYQSISLQLKSPDLFESFQKRITSDPQLKVKVMRQSEFYADQAVMITRLITILGRLVAFLMATGAVLGALNTMFNSVSQRTREIATLRALGFGRSPVVISVLIESMCLAVIGGIIGAGLAYAYFNGYRAATINWQSFSQVVFSFEVTTGLLIQGVVYACLIGLLGGLFPAVRASRLPIAQALREL
jgi:putative ABC transport system permease protein